MNWQFLSFLAEPWFVLPWYGIGIIGFFYLIFDIKRHNTPLKQAMKWAWPIIVLFFSVLGLALYFGAARAPGIAKLKDEKAKEKAHLDYEKNMYRRVNGAVIHCIAGDGLGIITAMVIARATDMSFWQEFWFEYLVGFMFGWFIFQYKSMSMMADSKRAALWMAFRGEFMSMLTVMGGMGLVMGYITPMVVPAQPDPLTYAFWGFAMLGLLMGYLWTWPMNWMMVKLGWKHGMGGMDYAHEKETKVSSQRTGLLASMTALGAVAMVIPAWAAEMREGTPLLSAAPSLVSATSSEDHTFSPRQGLQESVTESLEQLEMNHRSNSAHALDAAHRAVMTLHSAYPANNEFGELKKSLTQARHALHMGRDSDAMDWLKQVQTTLAQQENRLSPVSKASVKPYLGAVVLNAHGIKQGEIVRVSQDKVIIARGYRDVWGFIDFGGQQFPVSSNSLLWGKKKSIGSTMVLMPMLPPAASK